MYVCMYLCSCTVLTRTRLPHENHAHTNTQLQCVGRYQLMRSCNVLYLPSSATTGCYADSFVPNVRVGEAVNVSCSEAHPSFNPLGVAQWQCIGHLQWQGDLSPCTFKEEAQSPIALLSYQLPSLQVAEAVMMKSDLLSTVSDKMKHVHFNSPTA